MSERIHALAQRLFGKATIEECNLDEMKSLAQRYPYFAPAQFILLEKLKQVGSDEYSPQLQKAILYYHNPLEFQYFISSDRFYTNVSFDEEAVLEDPQADNESLDEEELFTGYGLPLENTIDTRVQSPDSGIGSTHQAEYVQEPGWTVHEHQLTNKSDTPVESEIVKEGQDATINDQPRMDQFHDTTPSHTVPVEEEPVTENAENVQGQQLPSPIQHPQLQTSASSSAPLAFEPYHTVDYFASQGIKLSQEEIPKDKLGKQLKSFTEWLRTMKRLPATQINKTADTGSEMKVQHMAEDSIHESDVWTEAMAEVWIKQGNRQKAIEVYNKLVLLNPSKRAYFATKIENLKHI